MLGWCVALQTTDCQPHKNQDLLCCGAEISMLAMWRGTCFVAMQACGCIWKIMQLTTNIDFLHYRAAVLDVVLQAFTSLYCNRATVRTHFEPATEQLLQFVRHGSLAVHISDCLQQSSRLPVLQTALLWRFECLQYNTQHCLVAVQTSG